MKKNIYITENLLQSLKERTIPKFLLKGIKYNCFLGKDNNAIPDEDDNSFIYNIIKDRYIEVEDNLSSTIANIDSSNMNEIHNLLSQLYKECKEIEKDIRPQLEKLCLQIVSDTFDIPENVINITCSLVDKITPKHKIRIKPESNKEIKFQFQNTSDIKRLSKEVLKRRVVNSLIQGASYMFMKTYDNYITELYRLNKKLPILYDQIIALNDFILFNDDDKVNEEHTKQGSYVEVEIGSSDTASNITAQGLIFPFLLNETFRGCMELFASHGLPTDNQEAMFVIRQADFLLAEPWDLRTGVTLWKLLKLNDTDSHILPFFFTILVKLDEDSFTDALKNIFSNTAKGDKIINMILSKSEKDYKLNNLNKSIEIKNNEYSLINDGYFSTDEFDTFMLDELNEF